MVCRGKGSLALRQWTAGSWVACGGGGGGGDFGLSQLQPQSHFPLEGVVSLAGSWEGRLGLSGGAQLES